MKVMNGTKMPEIHQKQNPNAPTTNPTPLHPHLNSSLFQPQNYPQQYYQYTLPSSYGVPHDSGYYLDPNSQNWAAKLSVHLYGSDPTSYIDPVGTTLPPTPSGTEHVTVAYPVSTLKTNPGLQLQKNGTWKKLHKKTKVIQSAYCDICKVECNSNEVLDNHKMGRKHKRNLEKLQDVSTSSFITSVGLNNPIIGPQENPDKSKICSSQRIKQKAEPVKDLETKRRKIVAGGASEEAVRMCEICNVVCNSETVFRYHLSGQKHAAMLKRHAEAIGVGTAT